MNYGYCPICGVKGISRERKWNGNDKCESGHIYLSSSALEELPIDDRVFNSDKLDIESLLDLIQAIEELLPSEKMTYKNKLDTIEDMITNHQTYCSLMEQRDAR